MAKRREPEVHGLVLCDKQTGWTSHDVVARLRRHLGERQVGHAGTLDPGATGLLVIGVGHGTRLLRFLGGDAKTYECEIVLGTTTDTLDDSGTVTATAGVGEVDLGAVRDLITAVFTGDLMQVPPMVSALRIGGKRLHQIAREGRTIERAPRPVRVDSFEVSLTDEPHVLAARIRCGPGTYVRSLGADLGEALGCGAHIRALRRLSSGPFSVEEASTLEAPVLHPVERIVAHLNCHVLDEAGVDDTLYGRVRPAWDDADPWPVSGPDGSLVAVFERFRGDYAKPTVVFGGR